MPDPLLLSAVASFHTNDDDKDDDTVLSIAIILSNGTLVGSVAGITGRFPDNHDNGPFGLIVFGQHRKSEMANARAALHIETNGDDTWKFNWSMVLSFDDGSQYAASWSGPFLSDEVRDRSYSLNVPQVEVKGFDFRSLAPPIKVRREI